MYITELEAIVEAQLGESVRLHHPYDWKEDAVTHNLLINLRKHVKEVTLHGARYPTDLEWEVYKLHGRRESAHGDIGLLVRYRVPEGGILEGAGFLEAKLRGRDSTRFLQVRHEQVTRILERSPQTQLLLYDYNPVATLPDPLESDTEWLFGPFRRLRPMPPRYAFSHGPVLPLRLAAAVNRYDDTLYRFAHSFSNQLCRRYFQLHDLDFSDAAVAAVKGFPGDLGSPNYVMIIRIAPQGQDLPEEYRPNDNIYGSME